MLPAMTYVAATQILAKREQNELAAAQTKMDRRMLNMTYETEEPTYWSERERAKAIDTIINMSKK